jgi:hypothetical protein
MKLVSPGALASLIVRRLEEAGEGSGLTTLSALLAEVVPYGVVRTRLGLAGKAEYDLAVIALLTNRELMQVDPAILEAAERALESPEPTLDFVPRLADALLRVRRPGDAGDPPAIAPGARPVEAAPQPAEPRGSGIETSEAAPGQDESVGSGEPSGRTGDGPRTEPIPAAPNRTPAPDGSPAANTPVDRPLAEGHGCWGCSADLPARVGVRFCPHCGRDQSSPRCTVCGDLLEPHWLFCPRCGRARGES